MSFLLHLLILVRNFPLYLLLFSWSEPKKRSISYTSISLLVMVSIYLTCYYVFELQSLLMTVIMITLPSLIVFFKFTQYKDIRFFFTFIAVDTISLLVLFILNFLVTQLHYNFTLFSLLYLVSLVILTLGAKHCASYYHRIMANLESGLGLPTLLCAFYYISVYLLVSYPPHNTETIYSSLITLYSAMTLISYIVVFRTIYLTQKVYMAKQEEQVQTQLKELYYKMAYIDNLTDLKNRHAYETKREEIKAARPVDQNICIISFDLNYLKLVNDTQGHAKGDLMIQQFSQVLRQTFFNTEHLFRIGGDEFIAIIEHDCSPETIDAQLILFADRLQQYSHTHQLPLSAAWGYAYFNPLKSITLDQACIKADQAMYEHKCQQKKNNTIHSPLN